jgi:hypothetical protein
MKHTLFIFALLTASIQTFAQSPRIKLNQITKDSVTGSVLISSPTDSGMVYSRDLFISYGVSDTVLILGGDTLAKTSGIISSVLSDGVTITGDGTLGSELTADTSVLATLRALSDSLALVISSVTADNVTITGDGTVGSPLKVDTATVIATKQDLNSYYLDSNPDGYTSNTGTVTSVGATAGTGISVSGSPITTSGTLTITNTAPDQTVSIAGGGINAVSGTYPSFTVTGTEVDGSVTNEGSLTVGAGTASTSVISSNTSGSTDVTLTAGTNVTLSETGNNITISATGGGGSYNNISETVDTVYISDYLDVDTATLYVDASTNRVGIGTSSPSAKLNVEGGDVNFDSGTLFVDDSENKVGIGETSLNSFTLTVKGALPVLFNTTSSANTLTYGGTRFFRNTNSINNGNGFQYSFNNSNSVAAEYSYFGSYIIDNTAGSEDGGFILSPTLNGVRTESMRILNNGNVGIGTSSPSHPLEMASGAHVTTGGTWTNASDVKLKNNINYIYPYGLSQVMNLKPVIFDYINGEKNTLGFIAQDVYEYIPEAISSTIDDNGNETMGLKMVSITSTLTKAIQEQQAIIESQANEIEQLKTLITELSNRLTILENN